MLVTTWEKARSITGGLHHCQRPRDASQWPERLTPKQLARLQAPGEVQLFTDAINRFCDTGELSFQVGIIDVQVLDQRTGRITNPEVRLIDAPAFAALLHNHRETPSEHIQAWFDARCSAPVQEQTDKTPAPAQTAGTPGAVDVAPEPPATPQPEPQTAGTQAPDKDTLAIPQETAQERQARRYKMCIDAGLVFSENEFADMPRGIGRVARQEGISTQAFSKDVQKHISGNR